VNSAVGTLLAQQTQGIERHQRFGLLDNIGVRFREGKTFATRKAAAPPREPVGASLSYGIES
jgi:hypothetical protein